MREIAFVVYYHKLNFYSLNSVIAALEMDGIFENIDFYFFRIRNEIVKNLETIIKSHDKTILGISFFTTQLFEISDLINTISSKYGKKCLYIAGGAHPTGDPYGTLRMGFDIVVVGEGEETIIELMRKLKDNENLSDIKGIAYKNQDEEYIYTGKRKLINLDKFPPFPIKNTRFGAIEITRGCPYVCYFCQTPYILGTAPRHRNIETICKYVKILNDYYGDLTDIRFITPNAFSYGSKDGKTLDLEKLESLLIAIRKIIGEKGKIFLGTFPSEVRPEHVTIDTLDLVLKYADNDNITIGAQSGSQRILDLCHREHSVADINKAVELTLKKNLKINVDFIFGLPGENDEDAKITIQMMRDLSNKGARIHAHTFIPLPQTPFAKVPVSRVKDLYKNEIKTLISKGSAFGDWRKQERLALKISNYMKTMNLK